MFWLHTEHLLSKYVAAIAIFFFCLLKIKKNILHSEIERALFSQEMSSKYSLNQIIVEFWRNLYLLPVIFSQYFIQEMICLVSTIDRQIDRQIERQKDRKIDRQRDRQRYFSHNIFTSGNDLPRRYGEFPLEFASTPICDIDPYYAHKKTFIVISKGNTIYRYEISVYLYSTLFLIGDRQLREFLSVHWTKGSCLRVTTCLRYSIENNIVCVQNKICLLSSIQTVLWPGFVNMQNLTKRKTILKIRDNTSVFCFKLDRGNDF